MIIRIINVKYPDLKPFDCVQIQLLVFDSNTWNHLTLCKQMMSALFKNNVTYKLFIYKYHTCIFLFDTNNLHSVVWFQVANNNNP